MTVSVLFVRSDSNYKKLTDVDVWDIDRDARLWPGGHPLIAHPPCRAWAGLRHMAKPRPGEKNLARLAVSLVREFGGVLEHPAYSTLWPSQRLPKPGDCDQFGGWTLPIKQHWWGHPAEKRTWLYIVGCEPSELPDMPIDPGDAPCVCGTPGRRRDGSRLRPGDAGWRPEISKADREHTPPLLAAWLVELANKCKQPDVGG